MSGRSTPKVSVVVLTWNNLSLIPGCLASIRQLDWPNLEIVVVDNGSCDGTADYLRQQADIELTLLPRNLGFAGGQVVARTRVAGDFVALINSDAVVAPDWIRVLMLEMDDPSVGAAGGRAYEWSPGTPAGDLEQPFYTYQRVDLGSGNTTTAREGDEAADVDAISGAAVLLRVSALDSVGGFDARFFAYYEETDLFARMLRCGLRIRYAPSAHVWHQIRGSSDQLGDLYDFYMERNRLLFVVRNFDLAHARGAVSSDVQELLNGIFKGRARRRRLRVLFSWLLLAPHALVSRRRIRRLGPTYCNILPSQTASHETRGPR